MPPTRRRGPAFQAADAPGESDSQPFSDVTAEPDFDLADSTPEPTPPKYRATPLKGKLTQLYGGIGLGVYQFDNYCGSVILSNAENTAESLDMLARENAGVKRVLEAMVATNAWAGVLMAHMPIVLAVMNHHGPPELQQRINGMMSGAGPTE